MFVSPSWRHQAADKASGCLSDGSTLRLLSSLLLRSSFHLFFFVFYCLLTSPCLHILLSSLISLSHPLSALLVSIFPPLFSFPHIFFSTSFLLSTYHRLSELKQLPHRLIRTGCSYSSFLSVTILLSNTLSSARCQTLPEPSTRPPISQPERLK